MRSVREDRFDTSLLSAEAKQRELIGMSSENAEATENRAALVAFLGGGGN